MVQGGGGQARNVLWKHLHLPCQAPRGNKCKWKCLHSSAQVQRLMQQVAMKNLTLLYAIKNILPPYRRPVCWHKTPFGLYRKSQNLNPMFAS